LRKNRDNKIIDINYIICSSPDPYSLGLLAKPMASRSPVSRTDSFAMASRAMTKILGNTARKKATHFTADGEIHVPPIALL
jgi:hypothetical protein